MGHFLLDNNNKCFQFICSLYTACVHRLAKRRDVLEQRCSQGGRLHIIWSEKAFDGILCDYDWPEVRIRCAVHVINATDSIDAFCSLCIYSFNWLFDLLFGRFKKTIYMNRFFFLSLTLMRIFFNLSFDWIDRFRL